MRDIVAEVEIAVRYSEAIHERSAGGMCVLSIYSIFMRCYIVEEVGLLIGFDGFGRIFFNFKI